MASPTRAEIFTMLGNLSDMLEALNTAFSTHLTKEDTYLQSLEGNFAADAAAAYQAWRAQYLDGALSPAALRSLFNPLLRELGAQMDLTETDIPELFRDIVDVLVAASQTVNERELSFGSISAAGGNTGNGTILRCTKTKDNDPIQHVHTEVKTFTCIQDQTTGAVEHEEVFEARGETAERGFLLVDGSGQANTTLIKALSARDSANLLSNPSFSAYTGSTGAGNMTALTDWTVAGTITSTLQANTSTVYRDYLGDTTPTSLLFTANETISQVIKDTRGAVLNPRVPYWLQCAVFPTTGTSAGTITLHMGSISRAVTLTGLSANAWNIVGIVSGGPDNTCWPDNFLEADLDIKIAIASLSGGTGVYVDDVIFAPGTRFDGQYWWIVPNAASNAAWKRLDSATFTDTESVHAEINYWAGFRTGYGTLPSTTGGTETYADV